MAEGVIGKIVTINGVHIESTSNLPTDMGLTFQKMYDKITTMQFDYMKLAMQPRSLVMKPREYGKSLFKQEYLCNFDPAKGKEKNMAAFVVGDRVRITGTDEDDDEDEDMPIGYIGKITDVNDDADTDHHNVTDGCVYEVDNGYSYGWGSLVAEKDIEGFRVGDVVQLSNTGSCGVFRRGNETSTITRIEDNRIYIKGDQNGATCFETARNFVLVKLIKENNNMSTVSNDPGKALRELNLDSDTRLLREMDFEDEKGIPSSRALTEMARRNWTTIRTEIATDLRTAIANEQSGKEANTDKA